MFKKREVKGKGIRRKREEDNTETNSTLGMIGSKNNEANEDNEGSAVIRDGIGLSKKRVNKFSTGAGGGFSNTNTGTETKNKSGHLGALLAVESEGNKRHEYGGSATATNDVDTAFDHDARAIAEKNIEMQNDGGGVTEDGTKIYRGQAGYKNYIAKDEASIGNNKNTGTQGPIRAPAFFRATCRFDYQPDICKDYKDTGFCGFGDSCKFMHDRGNYKTGYQMEKEWDDKQAERKRLISMGVDPDAEDEGKGDDEFAVNTGPDMPFACFICRGPFKDPIQTVCHHYFCQNCAVKQFRNEGPNCPICTKNTAGIFNNARKLVNYANTKGGFSKLFLQASGENEVDEDNDETKKEKDKDNSSQRSQTKSVGAWDVVDENEEGAGEGVAQLLSEQNDLAKKVEDEIETQKETQKQETQTDNVDKGDHQKLLEIAKSVGWFEVTAHGQTYWYNQTTNMTSREVPPQVTQLIP
mmetsp:Transcript_190/g.237  ORF Transcript_190/g.237 Transcript_190/m.237 type:complete len:468 (-) Transcript_190:75-1478(-)